MTECINCGKETSNEEFCSQACEDEWEEWDEDEEVIPFWNLRVYDIL